MNHGSPAHRSNPTSAVVQDPVARTHMCTCAALVGDSPLVQGPFSAPNLYITIRNCFASLYRREATVAHLIHGVVEALVDMHALGIVHRDVKPENFLLSSCDPSARVKAIDLGLAARFAPSLPGGGRTLPLQGTCWFVAPESVLHQRVGPESDMWAVGVLAYYLLTDLYPFDSGTCSCAPWRVELVAGQQT